MDLKIIQTKDGSSTLYNSELDEHYHSIHGANQESEHVYIKSGLDYFVKQTQAKSISVLEVGFGTGMNIALSYYWGKKHQVSMAITTMESYPLSWGLLQNYSFDIEDEEQIIQKLHELEWENINQVSNSFSLVKNQVRLEDFKSEESRYDVIFFDAFAPNKQEEIWSEGNLSKMYNVLRVGGCLVTYCAKGEIRRRFEKVGFKVSRIEGPPGKREMLRCEKV